MSPHESILTTPIHSTRRRRCRLSSSWHRYGVLLPFISAYFASYFVAPSIDCPAESFQPLVAAIFAHFAALSRVSPRSRRSSGACGPSRVAAFGTRVASSGVARPGGPSSFKGRVHRRTPSKIPLSTATSPVGIPPPGTPLCDDGSAILIHTPHHLGIHTSDLFFALSGAVHSSSAVPSAPASSTLWQPHRRLPGPDAALQHCRNALRCAMWLVGEHFLRVSWRMAVCAS